MQLTALSVQRVRKVRDLKIYPSTALNCICGANGSGKTSLLEAIHFLATARSFRTTKARDVITHGEQSLLVNGEFIDSAGQLNRVGVEKTFDQTRLRLNGDPVVIASRLAKVLPVLNFNSESFLLLSGGPSIRRSLLDRLMFHVEHQYLDTLKRYYRALKQRNMLLRARRGLREITAWDDQLVPEVAQLDIWRRNCVAAINQYLTASPIGELIGNLQLEYYRGWNRDTDFLEILSMNVNRDRETGTTTLGPHRAELRVKIDDKMAKTVVSRGQGKLIIAAIVGAQARYLSENSIEKPILLVDDLAAELDRSARQIALDSLLGTDSQIFFTAIDRTDLPDKLLESAKMFHVEHGQIQPVVTTQ
ncbi:MAG: DNA replication and repair protein RecF [Gammaproteobacteria bacterium]